MLHHLFFLVHLRSCEAWKCIKVVRAFFLLLFMGPKGEKTKSKYFIFPMVQVLMSPLIFVLASRSELHDVCQLLISILRPDAHRYWRHQWWARQRSMLQPGVTWNFIGANTCLIWHLTFLNQRNPSCLLAKMTASLMLHLDSAAQPVSNI